MKILVKLMSCTALWMVMGDITVNAQNNWQHTDDDRREAVEVDTITKGKYSLIWINKQADFDPVLKQKLIDTYFLNYPKLAKRYNKNTRKQVSFVIDPGYDGVAATAGGIVRYSPVWFAKNPNDIDVVTHEVMHIVQGYPNGSGPWWITEGIADYVRFTDGVDNASANWKLPDFKDTQKYSDSYRVTARFFYWLDTKVKRNIVKTLDKKMRDKTYSESFWMEQTGQDLDGLWKRYAADPSISQ